MTELFAPVCSIAPTKRRRFFWAAWWSGAPSADPFRKPDASSGGARTPEEALAEAERAAGAKLVEIEARWARAWARVLRGEKPWPRPASGRVSARKPAAATPRSIWQILGLDAAASAADVKRAYRQRALEAHPDRGGDATAFRELHRAYESALERIAKPKRRRRR